MVLANMALLFLCEETGLKSEELLSHFVSTAGKSLFGLDSHINTGAFVRKWKIKLRHTLYQGYINFKYFLLATDWPTLPTVEESVQRFTEIVSKLNNKIMRSYLKKIAKILTRNCKPVARVPYAARDMVFCCSHRLFK
jgi:hypothetical protein